MVAYWDCIVITCPTIQSVIATEKEISLLKKKGKISVSSKVLAIEDPAKNVGSGAATLNALLVAVEYLSAQNNYMVITADVLQNSRILILHNGRNYVYSCTGKAFITLPKECFVNYPEPYSSGLVTNIESTLLLLEKLSKKGPYGVWVCSTDMMVLHKDLYLEWENKADVILFCIPSDIEYASRHGVVVIDNEGYVADIIYSGSVDQIKNHANGDGKVPVVSGIVFISINVAESLLSLHVQSPLHSCTYLGLDSGAEPIQVSLFFDILIAMSTNINKNEFISGQHGKIYNIKVGFRNDYLKESYQARTLIWNELSTYRMIPKILHNCQHLYWSNQMNALNHIKNMHQVKSTGKIHSIYQDCESSLPSDILMINSIITTSESCHISSGVVINDCLIKVKTLNIGENSFISGLAIHNSNLEIYIPANIVVINYFLHTSYIMPNVSNIIAKFGINDNIMDSNGSNEINSKLFMYHHQKLNSSSNENDEFHIALLAKELLNEFPKQWCENSCIALSEIMDYIDFERYFNFRRSIYARIALAKIKNILCTSKDISVLPYFRTAYAEMWANLLINTLDLILVHQKDIFILTRTLSCMADILSIMAGKIGILRSGPGGNKAWTKAFELLLFGKMVEGMIALQNERSNWMDTPEHLIRAARHYERAAQILIQNSVKTVKEKIILQSKSLPDIGSFVVAECPVRIDIQGGWSDTPPICYELGGSVVNIAVLIDNKKPIGAKACRIKKPHIILKIGLKESFTEIMITDLKDVVNYDQPNAQGALLKAALICAEIVDIHSEEILSDQLMRKFGSGFEIQSWSLLPQGCGMGTSSILAGAVISVLWSVSGKIFNKLSIVHAVLDIEQLLTTGGGWQDQIGGVFGGINRGYSEASLPLNVHIDPLHLSKELVEKLNKHLLLIYTGKVRLAKNLLQNVIRNWYAREESVVNCFKNLILFSHEMKMMLKQGDLSSIGTLMNKYWEQKKILAPGCEPGFVKQIMEKLKPYCYGQLLVGAGGGGYMCVLTKEPNDSNINEMLMSIQGAEKSSIHKVTIHQNGLEIKHI